ncbi:hypothetical protein A5658_19405 [Mycobacterium sp. 1245111.1]|uniref:hypothetical protein n=1 Tax=Mycobacterium sp. 1245111.1 TaxID=1834073 RepID=UPI0007FC67DB|nr:hypothetical protein [Mycobacterium sp. 1245111.1]OBK41282.1 hypothetical protein A5658_19405 [Mycobacterium sp. 1245111.1]
MIRPTFGTPRVVAAFVGVLAYCLQPGAGIRLTDTSFPDLSGYTQVDSRDYFTMNMRQYFGGPTFSTPDGQRCSSNARDYLHRLWCSGPRPDKGGFWQVNFAAGLAATIQAEQPPDPDFKPGPDEFKLLPPLHKIVFDAFTCGVDDQNMFACRAGDHGFVFTTGSTTLF